MNSNQPTSGISKKVILCAIKQPKRQPTQSSKHCSLVSSYNMPWLFTFLQSGQNGTKAIKYAMPGVKLYLNSNIYLTRNFKYISQALTNDEFHEKINKAHREQFSFVFSAFKVATPWFTGGPWQAKKVYIQIMPKIVLIQT